MTTFRPWSLLFTVLMVTALAAGCAGTKNAAAPVLGAWNYTIDTPDGEYTGMFVLQEEQEVLGGTMVSATEGNKSYPVRDVAFQDSTLTFQVDHAQYGQIGVEAEVDGAAFSGTVDVPGQGRFPLTATRQTD